jgi:RNA polymerase sigma-70 factor, ECF subfamily
VGMAVAHHAVEFHVSSPTTPCDASQRRTVNAATAAIGRIPNGTAAIRAARRGEPEGWDWLFNRYNRLVLRYVMSRLGDADLAEDVSQDVFVAAVGAVRKLRDDSETGIEGWLLGIARHKVADRQRGLMRDRARSGVIVEDGNEAAEIAVDRISAGELRAAIEQLPATQREVIIRRFVLDQPLEQVAATTNRRLGAVKSMQHRALRSLERVFARSSDD